MLGIIVGGVLFVPFCAVLVLLLCAAFGALNGQLRTGAQEKSVQCADTFYEEFERQLAILEGKPDPIKVMKVRRSVPQLSGGEITLSSDYASFAANGERYFAPVSRSDTPLDIGRNLLSASRAYLRAQQQSEDRRAYEAGELEPGTIRHAEQALRTARIGLGWHNADPLEGRKACIRTDERGIIGVISTGAHYTMIEAKECEERYVDQLENHRGQVP